MLTKVLHAQPIYIQTVATHPEFSGRGVAQFMYRSLYERFPNDAFSAFIAMKPITNNRSLRFYHHQGFYAVGRLYQDQLLDLQNYEAVLMFRDKA